MQCSIALFPLTTHLKHTVLLLAVQCSIALFPSHLPPQIQHYAVLILTLLGDAKLSRLVDVWDRYMSTHAIMYLYSCLAWSPDPFPFTWEGLGTTHSATASSAVLYCPVPLSPPTSNTQCYCQKCSALLSCSPLTTHLKHTVLLPEVQCSIALFPSHHHLKHSATASSAVLYCPVPSHHPPVLLLAVQCSMKRQS